MASITPKTKERIVAGIKKFQPILNRARAADINESDTVTIIADMLCDVFGYDKYTEVTSEFAIKKTFCDLALKVDDRLCLLIECKAIGLGLKDDYIKQATDYAANAGVDWVVLTNGVLWKVYKITFAKPIDKELVYEFDFTELSVKKQTDVEMIFYLSRESLSKSSKGLEELHLQKQVLNKFVVTQLLMTEPIAEAVRKLLKKMSPDVKVTTGEISSIIATDVLKRDVVESDQSADAKKRVQKMIKAENAAQEAKKQQRASKSTTTE